MILVGVDVGGTFTDLVLAEPGSARSLIHKVSTTPSDPSSGVVEGIIGLCRLAGVAPGDVAHVLHGTTIATNAALEHRGAECGMITTRGYRDILHIGRHKRPYNFSLHFDVPWQSRPLVKRRNRIPITERVLPPTGEVAVPLVEAEILEAVRLFKKRGIGTVVVGFLFSFLNDAHERRAKEILLNEMPACSYPHIALLDQRLADSPRGRVLLC
jgi:N-methylhydantoinase A